MLLNSVLILILTCNELVAFHCGKGERVKDRGHGRKSCEPCPDGYYQNTDNPSQTCITCTECISGSYIKEKCTKVTNTKCQCRQGFVPIYEDSAVCKCDRGYELRGDACVRCDDGHFSLGNDASCKKWTDCKDTGDKVSGTLTSDAICNEVPKSIPITTASSSNQSVPLTYSTTRRPHEGAQTQMMRSTSRTISQANDKGVSQPPIHTNTGNHFGQALLVFGIAMVLVLTVVTVVTCKQSACPNLQKGPNSHMNDSLCRPPVEESGDSSESSTIKLNLEP